MFPSDQPFRLRPTLGVLARLVALTFAFALMPTLPALAAEPASSGADEEAKAPSAKAIAQAIQQGAALLVANQEAYTPDPPVGTLADDKLEEWQENERKRLAKIRKESSGAGSEWPYEGVYRVRPDGRIPAGYRVGGTAIACEALLRASGAQDEARTKAVERGIAFCLDQLEKNPELAAGPKRGYDVRGWGHTYALQLFLTALDLGVAKDEHERIREMIPDLIRRLAANEVRGRDEESRGGWNYANDTSASPFMTGPTLFALYHAKSRGHEVDAGLIERALSALERGRDEESGAWAYSGDLRRATPMPGSNARSAVAELALFRAGRSDVDRLRVAVAGFFDHYDELLKRKSKQRTHEPPYGVAPYYFFFGHTYAAMAIEALPEKERPKWRERLAATVMKTREEDGGWNDRVFPRTKSYSTAMCLLALLAPSLPEIPEWKAPKTGKGEEL